ncbi:hypothetical protein EVAR_83877_1 [Eumeta japonica]|uniref:Uncharacterized protein n=1 Tax=Eumeta variegata TaxID=151549 RepID=A0A4C1USH2_EUMVA|nr:hypothetical protein EVAR_83877_1 [Eumeta japonica]
MDVRVSWGTPPSPRRACHPFNPLSRGASPAALQSRCRQPESNRIRQYSRCRFSLLVFRREAVARCLYPAHQ